MEKAVVVGGGGHAKVILEIIEDAGEFEVVGCTSPDSSANSVLNVPVIGNDSDLPRIYDSGVLNVFIAVGDNRLRRSLSAMARAIGFKLINAVSPRAVLSPRIDLGDGIAIMAGVVINSCSRIGNGCIINTGATVDHDCSIGDWSHIAPGSNLAGCVTVGEGAFLGIGSRVIPRTAIGEWTVVGAGAVVVRDLPASVTAVGVPARVKGGVTR